MIEQIITSINNPIVKHVKQLITKKAREKNQQYIIDGLRIVKHALDNKEELDCVIITQEYKASEQFKSIMNQLKDIKVYVVDLNIMKHFVETENPQGIIGVVNRKDETVEDLGTILILDRIQDPGNIGTLIRTADAAGFNTVILVKGCTDPFSQKALRSSMGSVMTLNIVSSEDILADIKKLHEDGYKLYSAALENGKDFRSVSYENKKALVIGNEANGISNEILEISDEKIYIPMFGAVESLNASIAGGILMFEMNK